MEFWIAVIQTIAKMIIIAAVAFGGIMFGKKLRMKKNAKEAE